MSQSFDNTTDELRVGEVVFPHVKHFFSESIVILVVFLCLFIYLVYSSSRRSFELC